MDVLAEPGIGAMTTATELRAGYATIKSGRYQNGADYRGTLSDGIQAVWVCDHAHSFASSKYLNKGQQSALSCAKAELARRTADDYDDTPTACEHGKDDYCRPCNVRARAEERYLG